MSKNSKMEIDVDGLYYRDLNRQMWQANLNGTKSFVLRNVCGQRYIGSQVYGDALIEIHGTPGNDLASFMEGPTIVVHGNAEDAVGNTMNSGRVIVHGHAGDVVGFSMRGGELYIKGNVGYRGAIHMKASLDKAPLMVVGGRARDFLGEYMAGGTLVVLGLGVPEDDSIVGRFTGTGMHGGVMFIHGTVEPHRLGAEVGEVKLTDDDRSLLAGVIEEYGRLFDADVSSLKPDGFTKYAPVTHRPYGKLYAY